MKYFTGILYLVFGFLFILLYVSDRFREVIENLGVPAKNIDYSIWIGLFLIIFGIALLLMKLLQKKMHELHQLKQQHKE